ncbi:MAG: NUDIX hydrolase [Haliscomenobacter sp.]|nr:NUDIX hydrolase [Haliscomenobacter sp.]
MTQTDQWLRLRSEEGPNLKLFRARFDYMRNPRNGETERMIVLESADSVNVVALTAEQEMLFVRQYRFGIGQETLELPGGIVDPGEDHRSGAARELREETGFTGSNWTYLGKVASNPVFMDSYIHHWLLEDAQSTHELELDAGETVTLERIPVAQVRNLLWEGAFMHPHTVSALVRYFAHQTV